MDFNNEFKSLEKEFLELDQPSVNGQFSMWKTKEGKQIKLTDKVLYKILAKKNT